MQHSTSWWHRERGAVSAEYALLVSLIAVVVIGGVAFVGTQVFGLFSDTEDAIARATEPITVSAPLAGTIEDAPPVIDGTDACPSLPGTQAASFDCTLPLNVPAVFVGNAGGKVKYTCPGAEYQLVRGQKLELNKQCVLKSAA